MVQSPPPFASSSNPFDQVVVVGVVVVVVVRIQIHQEELLFPFLPRFLLAVVNLSPNRPVHTQHVAIRQICGKETLLKIFVITSMEIHKNLSLIECIASLKMRNAKTILMHRFLSHSFSQKFTNI